MRYDRTIIGYHGTNRETADKLFAGVPFQSSAKHYDWLGSGVYFWEFGYDRAVRWVDANYGDDPAVVGAVIQLGSCFDLLDTRFTLDLGQGAKLFHAKWTGESKPPKNRGSDRKARFLDCAVINWWLEQLEASGTGTHYQTVRCGFNEGEPVHSGMEILSESHVQIAVRDLNNILGVFRPSSIT